MSNDLDLYFLTDRRGTRALIARFVEAVARLEAKSLGLAYLLRTRIEATDREAWKIVFEVWRRDWVTAFAENLGFDVKIRMAQASAGFMCLESIATDLGNDLWTDACFRNLDTPPSLQEFERNFWALVNQKMLYRPIMIACDFSMKRAIEVTKYTKARRQLLTERWMNLPETDDALFALIAKHLGGGERVLDQVREDLPIFLDQRNAGLQARFPHEAVPRSICQLDEFDAMDAEAHGDQTKGRVKQTHTTSEFLSHQVAVGTLVANDETVGSMMEVLKEICLPKLRSRAPELFRAYRAFEKAILRDAILPGPGEEAEPALRVLNDCISNHFESLRRN